MYVSCYCEVEPTWLVDVFQSRVTEHNYISLAQFEYAVFFEENYEEEIASGALLLEEMFKKETNFKIAFY